MSYEQPEVISPAPRTAWSRIWNDDSSALAEHLPEWTDAICADGRFRDASRLYEFPDGRQFVLPLLKRRGWPSTNGFLASPPPAWGFGGPVGAGRTKAVIAAIGRDVIQTGALRTSIRPVPADAALWTDLESHAATQRLDRCAHVVDLRGGMDDTLARMGRSTRRNIRLAERSGVRVVESRGAELMQTHYDLYLESVTRWAGMEREPRWSAHWRAKRRDPIHKLSAMAESLGDRFKLLLAYVDDVPVASLIMLIGNDARYTRGAMNKALAGPTRANFALHRAAMEIACAQGCGLYNMGESGTSVSLSRFKQGLGATAVDYAEYRFERLPFTRIDRVARSTVKRAIGMSHAASQPPGAPAAESPSEPARLPDKKAPSVTVP